MHNGQKEPGVVELALCPPSWREQFPQELLNFPLVQSEYKEEECLSLREEQGEPAVLSASLSILA